MPAPLIVAPFWLLRSFPATPPSQVSVELSEIVPPAKLVMLAPLIVNGEFTEKISPLLMLTVPTAKVTAFPSEVVVLIVFEESPMVSEPPVQVPVPTMLCAPLRSNSHLTTETLPLFVKVDPTKLNVLLPFNVPPAFTFTSLLASTVQKLL